MDESEEVKRLKSELHDLQFRYGTVCLALYYEWMGKQYDTETCNRLVMCIDDIDPEDIIRVVMEQEISP